MAKKKANTPAQAEEIDLKKYVEESARVPDGIGDALKEYDVLEHGVFSTTSRPKKPVSKPDPSGKLDDKGYPVMTSGMEEVVRIGIPFQKLIVKRRAAFMNAGAMVVGGNPEKGKQQDLMDAIKKAMRDNKMRYKLKEVAKRQMSEKHCAMLFYSSEEKELKMRIISPALGDDLYPVFDATGDLTHFGRGYTTKGDGGKDINHFDIYTAEKIVRYSDATGTMGVTGEVPLKYTKMPIIYFAQNEAEWSDVQSCITRLEELLSNFGDTNDYNGSPILVAKGTIKGFSAKGERGKVLEIEGEDASVEYVSWQQAPESIKLEIETLIDLIYTMTQTPNITLKELSGLGQSGVSFDRIFMDPHMAAEDKLEGGFGEGLQRMLNFIKAAICNVFDTGLKVAESMEVEAIVMPFRINEVSENIENMMAANGGKPIISQRTAVAQSGLVDDPDAEMEMIQSERDTLGQEIEEE